MTDRLSVFATITPKPPHFEEAQIAIEGIVDRTREEEGCDHFSLHAAEEGGALHLVERWRNRAALDAHYARAKAAGAEIVIDIADQDYGGRLYVCRDPEGHVWNFGSYDPWT